MKRVKKIVGIFFLIEFVVSIFATFPILTDHPFVAIGTCSFLGGISFLLLHQPRKPETQFVIILKKVVLCIMGTIFALSGIGGILGCTVALNVPTVIFFIIFSVVFFALGIVCFHSALKKHTIPIPEDANSQTDNCCQTTDFVATENTLPDNVEEMHTNCVPLEMPAANEKVGLADAEEMTVEDQASDAHKNASSDTPPVSYIEDGSSIYRTDGKPISDEEVTHLMQSGYEEALQSEKKSDNPKFHRTDREEELSFNFAMKYEAELYIYINQFEDLYRSAYHTDDLSQKIDLLNRALTAFEKAKKFAYSKGKGGTIYFQDMFEHLHNSNNGCFSYANIIQDCLDSAIQERDVTIPGILQIVSDNDGILQKNVYNKLPSVSRSDIQRVIRKLEQEHRLTRAKKSGSYELHIVRQSQ